MRESFLLLVILKMNFFFFLDGSVIGDHHFYHCSNSEYLDTSLNPIESEKYIENKEQKFII